MKILGIHASFNGINHDPSACLMIDGKIMMALEEERFNRVKTSVGYFPYYSISEILNRNKLSIKDIDLVVSTGITFKPLKKKIHNSFLNYFGFCPEVKLINHAAGHIYGSYFSSGFSKSLCISIDALGDGLSMLAMQAKNGKFKKIFSSGSLKQKESLGVFYAAFTEFLGFRRSEGEFKFMGMSAYGKKIINLDKIIKIKSNNRIYLSKHLTMENKIPITSTYEPMVNVTYLKRILGKKYHRKSNSKKFTQDHFDLALSVQKKYEEILIHYIKEFKGNNTSLCMSGGCALNCLANASLEKYFKKIYVMPAASDRGLSIGSAYGGAILNKIKTKSLDNMFLGINYSDKEIENQLNLAGIKYKKTNKYISAARDLKNKKIIGWFQGKSEFGPRALGGRSILALASIKDIKQKINNKIKFREEFRPFAPVVLYEYAKKFNLKNEYPYMTIASFPHKDFKNKIKAAVHYDGSTRLQTVKNKSNPLYNLLKKLDKDNQVLINTSFNTSGEPIVEKPIDAIRTFYSCGLDAMYLNNFRITKN